MNSTLARQWEILRIVPKNPHSISATELFEALSLRGFDVSKRTIERDLRELSKIFPLCADETAQPFRWSLLKAIDSDFGAISIDEAISLSLAKEVLGSTLLDSSFKRLEPRFEISQKKLQSLGGLKVVKLQEKFAYIAQYLPFKKVTVQSNVLDTITQAILEDIQLSLHYDPMLKERRKVIINPLGLAYLGVRPYLICTHQGEDKIRTYALQRVRKAELLETKSQSPQGFSLAEYIASDAMQFGVGTEIKLKAIISESLASYLQESAISADQKIRYIDTEWHLSASLKDSWALYMWVRSQGSEIKVLSPKRLKDKICADLAKSLKNYNL